MSLVAPMWMALVMSAAPKPTLPEHLADTGLFVPGTLVVAPDNRPFAPQYPLWSDGAAKARWVRFPDGSPGASGRATIDVSQLDAWQFPVGTRFWKELAFDGVKIETRMLWHATPDQWLFATYVWNEAQTDATLAPQDGLPGAPHPIPSVDDCHACHEGGATPVLGFTALQLSDDRDPLAPHADALSDDMITLADLVAEGRLAPPRPDLVAAPPRIAARTPEERAALGYLAGNCGGCHNNKGPLAPLGLTLAHDSIAAAEGEPAPTLTSTVDVVGRFIVPGIAPELSRRVAPGAPEHSALVYRMRSRRPSSQMPPLGSRVPDADAIALVSTWVRQLESANPNQ